MATEGGSPTLEAQPSRSKTRSACVPRRRVQQFAPFGPGDEFVAVAPRPPSGVRFHPQASVREFTPEHADFDRVLTRRPTSRSSEPDTPASETEAHAPRSSALRMSANGVILLDSSDEEQDTTDVDPSEDDVSSCAVCGRQMPTTELEVQERLACSPCAERPYSPGEDFNARVIAVLAGLGLSTAEESMRGLASEDVVALRERKYQAEAVIARRLLEAAEDELVRVRARTARVGEFEDEIQRLKTENDLLRSRLAYAGLQSRQLRDFVAQSTCKLADAVLSTEDFAMLAVEFRDTPKAASDL